MVKYTKYNYNSVGRLHQACGSEVLDCFNIQLLPTFCVEAVNKNPLHTIIVADHDGLFSDAVDCQCVCSFVDAV